MGKHNYRMKQIYLFEPQLIGRDICRTWDIVEVSDKRAQDIIKNGKGEVFTGDVDLHYNNWLKHSGYSDTDVEDTFRSAQAEIERQTRCREEYETARLEREEYDKAVQPKPKAKRKRKKVE